MVEDKQQLRSEWLSDLRTIALEFDSQGVFPTPYAAIQELTNVTYGGIMIADAGERDVIMALNFPVVEDIHLGNAPLREVICQVKFPTILRIAHEEPADFQERIRERFPVLDIERQVIVETEGKKPEARADVRSLIFRFCDRKEEDATRTVSLAPDFYSLSVTAYQSWPHFADHLEYVAEAAQEVYKIPYATRIGLRYINVLDEAFSDSGDFGEVFDLLRGELIAMLKTGVISAPDLAIHRIRTAANDGRFSFQYGLTHRGTPPKPQFLLDFDYYAEGELELDDLISRCEGYHQHIYNAFRWCIAEGKLSIFQPKSTAEKGV